MWHIWRHESAWLCVFSMAICQADIFRMIINQSILGDCFALSHSCGVKEKVEWLLLSLNMTKEEVSSTNGKFSPSWPQDLLLHKDSMGQELRQGTTEMACLFSIMSKARTGETYRLVTTQQVRARITGRHLHLRFQQFILSIGQDISWGYWLENLHGASPCSLGFLSV